MGLKRENPLPPSWGPIHFQMGAYFSSMICGRYPTNFFIQTLPLQKYLISPEWTQLCYPKGVKPLINIIYIILYTLYIMLIIDYINDKLYTLFTLYTFLTLF
jgi:hypothetical protein